MNRKTILTLVTAFALMLAGTAIAAACDNCGATAACSEPAALQEFKQTNSPLFSELRTTELELRNEFSREGIDPRKTGELEERIKELKSQLRSAAQKAGLPACCAV